MLDTDQFTSLHREYRDTPVLSVYLDIDQRDFAERGRWRTSLDNLVSAQREKASDAAAFDRALAHLAPALEPDRNNFKNGRGWAGFATADELILAGTLPTPMPDLARWERGLHVAPYVRTLKQDRSVVAAIVDSRRARVLLYRQGGLSEEDSLRADTFIGDLTDVNVAKRPAAHSGVRGKTGTDAARRILEVERDRLLRRVAEEVTSQAGDRGFVVVGGIERAMHALLDRLDNVDATRVARRPGLNFHMSEAEIRETVEEAASELSSRRQARILEQVVEQARAGGRGTLGPEDTERALEERRVDTLLVSRSLRREQPDLAARLEGAAFDQGASVVEASREAGGVLDREGEGVGALLRFRIRT